MRNFLACLIGIVTSFAIYANEVKENTVVEENALSGWGYLTKSLSDSYDYTKLNEPGPTISVKHQRIRSKLAAHDLPDTYFYFELSEECFSNKYQTLRRRFVLSFRDEKDYRLAFVNGNCVYITACSAQFETFEEQPKIHKLFQEYVLSKKSHNTLLKPEP
jgi:hypothetical protein